MIRAAKVLAIACFVVFVVVALWQDVHHSVFYVTDWGEVGDREIASVASELEVLGETKIARYKSVLYGSNGFYAYGSVSEGAMREFVIEHEFALYEQASGMPPPPIIEPPNSMTIDLENMDRFAAPGAWYIQGAADKYMISINFDPSTEDFIAKVDFFR